MSVIIYCHLLTRTHNRHHEWFQASTLYYSPVQPLYPPHRHNKILLFCNWPQHMSIPCFFSFNTAHPSYTAAAIRGKIACSTISVLSPTALLYLTAHNHLGNLHVPFALCSWYLLLTLPSPLAAHQGKLWQKQTSMRAETWFVPVL